MTQDEAYDLYARFFANTAPNQIRNINDLGILLEEAMYFFLSAFKNNSKLALTPKLYKRLISNFFSFIPELKHFNTQEITTQHFSLRDHAKPCGCICYNPEMTHVLVVHHNLKKNLFSFPKGKMEENESYAAAAVRETLEETGVDVSPYINENFQYTYERKGKSTVTMFHVLNVPMISETLQSPSPLEIFLVRWVKITDIGNEPDYSPDPPSQKQLEMILSFVEQYKSQS